MNVSQLKQSRFLTRHDVGAGVLVTIKGLRQENMSKEGMPEELRWVMDFNETDKPLVLNSTNGQICAQILKSDETDNWIGHKIVLYDDPNISFAGKLTGGIRVRAPRNQPAPVAKPAAPARPAPAPRQEQPRASEELNPAEEMGDDSVPF